MSIKKTTDAGDKVTLEIDNGHLETLKKITKDYDIKDIEKALGFIIAVISKANGSPVKIGDDTFVPGRGIKNEPVPKPATEAPQQ